MANTRIIRLLRDLPINRKLTLISTVISAVTLLIASAVIALLTAVGGVVLPATAQISASEQVGTFVRIFDFDRSLAGSAITLVIVEGEAAASGFDTLAAAFESTVDGSDQRGNVAGAKRTVGQAAEDLGIEFRQQFRDVVNVLR